MHLEKGDISVALEELRQQNILEAYYWREGRILSESRRKNCMLCSQSSSQERQRRLKKKKSIFAQWEPVGGRSDWSWTSNMRIILKKMPSWCRTENTHKQLYFLEIIFFYHAHFGKYIWGGGCEHLLQQFILAGALASYATLGRFLNLYFESLHNLDLSPYLLYFLLFSNMHLSHVSSWFLS